MPTPIRAPASVRGRGRRGRFAGALGVGEIALRVGRERIVVFRERPQPRAAATDLLVLAVRAAALEVFLAFAEPGEQRVRLVLPDVAERSVAHVAEAVPLPELREVDVALIVDVGAALAGRVAAVASQVPVNAVGPSVAEFLARVLDEEPRVGVVADEQRLDLLAALAVLAGHVAEPAHRRAALVGREVDVADVGAPAAVVEVVEAEAIDAAVRQQVDDALQILGVVAGDRVAQSRLEADVETRSDAVDRLLEGPFLAPELVVALGEPVDRDAGIRQ